MSQIRPAFFLLRSPLLSFDELAAWSAGLEAPAALDAPERLEAALAADRARLRAGLAEIVARPAVRDALYVASPDLDHNLESWWTDPDGERGRRAERTLVRYVARMAARSTPFGLFAGCAVGAIGTATRLTLPARSDCRRHTRLDMQYLSGLVGALERDPAVREALLFRPSSGLYRLGDRWQWIELTPDDRAHSHRLRRLDASRPLNALLSRAAEGATLADLRAVADLDVEALVDQRLLVSDLQPAVTGPEPIHGLIERLAQLAPSAPLASTAAGVLREVRDILGAVDEAGIGVEPDRYRRLAILLEALPGTVDRSKLIQSDLIKTAPDGTERDGLTLGGEVLAEIERGVEILRRLSRPAHDHLSRFRAELLARYEGRGAHRGVSLVELLDPDVGVGFGSSTGHDGSTPLLEGLELPAGSDERSVRWGDRHTFLFERLAAVLAAGTRDLVLDDADLERIANKEVLPLPDAFCATALVVASTAEAVAGGQFQVLLLGLSGPSGARLLGRFCHGDPALRELVRDHLRAEEALRPDVVFAEIAHLPDPRAGNILLRPLLRNYEITYLGASGAPLERQIPLDDLIVSVVGERIVLRSARLGREVIPRLTSAQNYFHVRTTPLYHFLAALQTQGVATRLSWDWGPLAHAPFLPRVSSGRLVLARAQWRVRADEIDAIGRARGRELFRVVHGWRERRGIPRYIRLADGDSELLVDFDNVLSVESFAQLLKGRNDAILVEALPGPGDLCATSPEGRFFHELLIPFVGTPGGRAGGEETCSRAASLVARPPSLIRRSFPPGSEWLFAKLYAPPSMIDSLLREVVRPVVSRALRDGGAAGWFFVRYRDPDEHLRLRLRGDPTYLYAEVLPSLRRAVDPLLATGCLQRFQLDTYHREIERYGGPEGIALSERVFEVDSWAALEIVEAHGDDALVDIGWRLAIVGTHLLLDDLGLKLAERLDLLRAMRDTLAREHRADQKLLRQLGARFRVERAVLEALIDPARAAERPLPAGLAALHRRSERVATTMAELRRVAADGHLTLPIDDLARSYLHMHVNRLLRSEHRRHELVLYDFLYRLYDARAARSRPANRP